ncbi:hypothetical protein ACW9HH_09635, partial [Nocardia gipuzkoensis]
EEIGPVFWLGAVLVFSVLFCPWTPRPFGQPQAHLPEARHPRWSAGAGAERAAGYAAWSWEC